MIDSLIGQKDYISELCSLTLGNYLAQKDPTYPSGWDGSYGPTVLKQMLNYGIVPMSIQKDVGCGGLTNYPKLNLSEEGASTTPKQYAVISESISERYEWHTLLSIDTAFIDERYNSEKVLFNIKKSLNEGTRVTFGVLLDLAQGLTGAVGSHHVHNDTWMMTPAILDDIKNNRISNSHEMIIIGYDDNMVVKDSNGHANKGLLTLRNSWGKFSGDHGNNYMTYEHFMQMTHEAQVVTKKK